MNTLFAKISILLLTITAIGQNVSAEESLSADDTHALDSIALARANDEIDGLKKEVENLKVNAGIQEREHKELQNVIQILMPYAEEGFKAQTLDANADFDHIDTQKLTKQSKTLEMLSPYSKVLKAQSDTLNTLLKIVVDYAKCNEFDNKKYSKELVSATEYQLIDMYDKGEKILNQLQQAQIDSLYIKVGNYRAAVETFETLIQDIDLAVGQFRDNPKGDKISAIEIENVRTSNKAKIGQIKSYRYLGVLYEKYVEELEKNPRSLTEAVRNEIATMLSKSLTPETADSMPENGAK